MSRLTRYLGIAFAVLAFVVAVGGFSLGKQRARAAAPAPNLPATTCDFTVLNFNLSGTGAVGATRAISVTAGDTFEQFIATPITATASSSAYSTVNDSFSGTVSGGVTGNFTLNNLNGVLVTAPEGFNSPRGFSIHDIVIDGAGGTITAAIALNFVAFTSSPPYYPRAFNGYLHSTATTGSYAPYKFNGTIAGTIFQGVGGGLTIVATVLGRLYTGGGTLTELVTGIRSAPPDRATTFEPGDIIAQFRSGDLNVGATSAGHVTPRTNLIGTTTGTIDGAFLMDHQAQVVDAGTQSGKGWLVGEYSFTDSGGNLLTGPWLSDVSGNSVSGYVWQVIGTGIYTDSLLFGTIDGGFAFGGTTFVGTMSGVYCEGSVIPTATPQETATASTTAGASSTPTATGQPATSTATPTSTPSPCGNYLYATGTATIVPGTVDTGNHCDDCVTTISLPFAYTLYDQTFTTVRLDSNGRAAFGADQSTFGKCFPVPGATYTIYPDWTDLMTSTETGCSAYPSGCGIFTSTSGTSPNRIFNIEWRAVYFGLSNEIANFEIRLYEGQSRFDIIYGTVAEGNLGIAGVQKDGSFFTEYFCFGSGGTASGSVAYTLDSCETPASTPTLPALTATSTPTIPPSSTPTATATLCPINFSDVHPTDYFYEAVQYLYCHGAISGYSDGTFRPFNNTTRGQLSKIVVLAEGWTIDTTGGPHFSDVQTNNPFYDYIETAYNHQIISGYSDGTFRWGNNVTRAQLCKIIVSAEAWAIDTTGGPHFSDVPTTDPFYGYIETAYNHAIISGYADGTFRPGNYATRGQISKIVYNAVVSP